MLTSFENSYVRMFYGIMAERYCTARANCRRHRSNFRKNFLLLIGLVTTTSTHSLRTCNYVGPHMMRNEIELQ
jgi:hypothetical protein